MDPEMLKMLIAALLSGQADGGPGMEQDSLIPDQMFPTNPAPRRGPTFTYDQGDSYMPPQATAGTSRPVAVAPKSPRTFSMPSSNHDLVTGGTGKAVSAPDRTPSMGDGSVEARVEKHRVFDPIRKSSSDRGSAEAAAGPVRKKR